MGFTSRESEKFEKPEDKPANKGLASAEALPDRTIADPRADYSKTETDYPFPKLELDGAKEQETAFGAPESAHRSTRAAVDTGVPALRSTETADGARIDFDAESNVRQVRQSSGAVYEQTGQNQIIETKAGGQPVVWSETNGYWTSNSDHPRRNFKLHDDGTVSFEDKDGIKHSINGKGIETLEGAQIGRITPDALGRPTEVETVDGKKVRRYVYFDDQSRDVKSMTIIDKTTNRENTFTRASKETKTWYYNNNRNIWQGEVQVSNDGIHSVREQRYSQNNPAARWDSHHPDGRRSADDIGADGSRSSYNEKNELISHRGIDGTRIDRFVVQGQEVVKHFDPKTGEMINWVKGSDGTYISDSARIKDVRRDLSFNTNGEFAYTNERGAKVQENRNGSKVVLERDGTRLEFDRDNQIVRATKGNLERTFIREGGEVKTVRDRNLSTKEEKTVFELRPKGEENRLNIAVSAQGDLSYQNPDGTAVIERANMLHVELDRDGDITKVVGPKSTRQYQYFGEGDNKAIISVTDTRTTERGTKTENWTRVANSDGTLSGEFRGRGEDGKDKKSRYNITACADGEYEYRSVTDKPGEKAHIARLTREGMDGMPESIEDARQELLTVLEGNMDQARIARNMQLMRSFEKRMMDQTELLIAAGINSETAVKEAEKCIVETYYHCGRLAGSATGPKALYDHKTRVRLAENLLYLGANPSDIKQGNTGTCWWESSWNVGLFQRNANHASRMICDIALTGQYTSTAGSLRGGAPKTMKIRPEYVRVNSGDHANWTPENAKSSSRRSPVGMIIDQVGPPLGGQRGWGQSNAGWHSEARNILYMMTGKDQIRHGSSGIGRHEKIQLLKTGGWTSSGGGHMWGYSMRKDRDGSWLVLRDDQYTNADRVIERVRNLRAWISGDVQNEVRKAWRPSKNTDTTRTSYTPYTPYSPQYQTTLRRNSPNDNIAPRPVQMPKPTWQPAQWKGG